MKEVGRHRLVRADLRPDERAAGCASPRRSLGPHGRRVLPRRRERRTCSCSSTTSSASRRRAPKCRRCSAACRARWVTSRRWRRRWAICRSASRRRSNGSITSVQAIYVPADDITDPAPATAFAHLDATVVLSRAITELGIYPAVDPLASSSRILDRAVHRRAPLQGGDRRAAHPAALQGAAGHHRDPRHGRAVAKTTRRSSAARAAFSASCRSRSRWPSSSRASRAST